MCTSYDNNIDNNNNNNNNNNKFFFFFDGQKRTVMDTNFLMNINKLDI